MHFFRNIFLIILINKFATSFHLSRPWDQRHKDKSLSYLNRMLDYDYGPDVTEYRYDPHFNMNELCPNFYNLPRDKLIWKTKLCNRYKNNVPPFKRHRKEKYINWNELCEDSFALHYFIGTNFFDLDAIDPFCDGYISKKDILKKHDTTDTSNVIKNTRDEKGTVHTKEGSLFETETVDQVKHEVNDQEETLLNNEESEDKQYIETNSGQHSVEEPVVKNEGMIETNPNDNKGNTIYIKDEEENVLDEVEIKIKEEDNTNTVDKGESTNVTKGEEELQVAREEKGLHLKSGRHRKHHDENRKNDCFNSLDKGLEVLDDVVIV